MAYTLTYSELVTQVKSIVENDVSDFVAQLPKIIAIAQDTIQRDLDLSIWRTVVADHVTAGSAIYPSRADTWLKVLSIWIPSEGVHLERRSKDYVRMFSANRAVPRYWAEISETELQVAPIPLQNYSIEVDVHKRLPALSDSNQSNWISKNCADLLLLATLIGSESYLVAPERVAEFSQLYAATLAGAIRELRGVEREEGAPVRAAVPPKISGGG